MGDCCAAVLVGYEALIRLGVVIKGPAALLRRVWPSHAAAAFGSAAAASRAYGLSVEQTAGALATALAFGSGPPVSALSSSSSRWMTLGVAAANGELGGACRARRPPGQRRRRLVITAARPRPGRPAPLRRCRHEAISMRATRPRRGPSRARDRRRGAAGADRDSGNRRQPARAAAQDRRSPGVAAVALFVLRQRAIPDWARPHGARTAARCRADAAVLAGRCAPPDDESARAPRPRARRSLSARVAGASRDQGAGPPVLAPGLAPRGDARRPFGWDRIAQKVTALAGPRAAAAADRAVGDMRHAERNTAMPALWELG